MGKKMIKFEWQGDDYEVDLSAYEANGMVLPCGTILYVEGWLETYPPQMASRKAIPTPPSSSPQEIASQEGLPLARKIDRVAIMP